MLNAHPFMKLCREEDVCLEDWSGKGVRNALWKTWAVQSPRPRAGDGSVGSMRNLV